jgi:hypothetical protein
MKSNVRKYTSDQLLKRVKSLPSFKEIPKDRWIIGVRSNEDASDTYDDKFYEFEGEEFIRVVTGTTNPGKPVLIGGFKKYNKRGGAVVVADHWYYRLWTFGLHRGKMRALIQLGAQVLINRDGNLNLKSEDQGNHEWGWFGINYHSNTYDWSIASLKIVRWIIGDWSAGCQVINDRIGYKDQMDYYEKAKKEGKQMYVTYVLLDEFIPE